MNQNTIVRVSVALLLAGGVAACAVNPETLPLVQTSDVQRLVVVNTDRTPITLVPAAGANAVLSPDGKMTIDVVVESRRDGTEVKNYIREVGDTHLLGDGFMGKQIVFRDAAGNGYFLPIVPNGCGLPWQDKKRAKEDHTIKTSVLVPLKVELCPSI